MPSNKRTKPLHKQQQTSRLAKTSYTCQAPSTYRLPRGTHTTIFPGSSDQESCQNLDCNSLSLSSRARNKGGEKKRKWSMALRGGRGNLFPRLTLPRFNWIRSGKRLNQEGFHDSDFVIFLTTNFRNLDLKKLLLLFSTLIFKLNWSWY